MTCRAKRAPRSRPAPVRAIRLTFLGLLSSLLFLSGSTSGAAVPAPFQPLQVQTGEASLTVSAWGREYVFERGPLPKSIVSQGVELIPSGFSFRAAASAGAARSLVWSATALEAASAESIRLRSRSSVGGVAIEAVTEIEYDGMIRVRIEARSVQGRASLASFSYGVELSREVAKYFAHHIPYDYRRLNVAKGRMTQASGLLSRDLSLDFTPTFSLANREVGLEWWSETNFGWTSGAASKPIEVRLNGDHVDFRVRPMGRAIALGAGETWSHEFAFFPLPLRPSDPESSSVRFISGARRKFYSALEDFRYFWIAFPAHFESLHHGLPESAQNDRQAALRRKLEKDGVGYVPYGKLTAAPSYHPETLARVDDWAANDRLFTGPAPAERKKLEQTTDWKKGQFYSYAVCMGDPSYSDWLVAENLRVLSEESLDGLYFDHGGLSRECARDPRSKTSRNVEVWNYFEVRRFYKKLFEEVKARDPSTLLTMHSHGHPKSLAAWLDFMFIGEGLNVVFREGASWKKIKKDPEGYKANYLSLPPGFLDSLLFPVVGGMTSLLPQIKYASRGEDGEPQRSMQREFLTYTLSSGTHTWFANSDHALLEATYTSLDRFFGVGPSRFVPWWAFEAAPQSAETKISAYVGTGSALYILANFASQGRTLRFETRAAFSNESARLCSYDLETGLRLPSGASGDPSKPGSRRMQTAVTVPPKDFRLVAVLDVQASAVAAGESPTVALSCPVSWPAKRP